MTFDLNEKTLKKSVLKFNPDIPRITYRWDLPILVAEDLSVYLGSCFEDTLPDNVKCIVIKNDEYLLPALKEVEMGVAEENSVQRLNTIKKEMETYLALWKPTIEVLSLFSDEELRDNGLITEENYKPVATFKSFDDTLPKLKGD